MLMFKKRGGPVGKIRKERGLTLRVSGERRHPFRGPLKEKGLSSKIRRK